MAKIQILEISPAETPLEDLSDDVAGNVTGSGFVQEVALLIDKLINFATLVVEKCSDGSLTPEQCDRLL